jgi:hypothetical protein
LLRRCGATELVQYGFEALRELQPASGPQGIDNDLEFARCDDEVQAIRVDIESRIVCWI